MALSNPPPSANPFLLAADASPALLPLLRSQPSLVTAQDASGYSLLHALASYNHLHLLRAIVAEFHTPPDLRDEDGETALFVVETVEAAQILLEDLGIDPTLTNHEGQTAEERIRTEGDFTTVADYLSTVRQQRSSGAPAPAAASAAAASDSSASLDPEATHPPPLPKGMTLNVGSMSEADETDAGAPDAAFRARIEALAQREDFEGDEGQEQLRELVRDAVRDVGGPGEGSAAPRPRVE